MKRLSIYLSKSLDQKFHKVCTGLVDERRAVDIVYLDFSKAFKTLSHKILIENF